MPALPGRANIFLRLGIFLQLADDRVLASAAADNHDLMRYLQI